MALTLENSEYIRIRVKDATGNVRAMQIPFRILDTRLLDELLKRKKDKVLYFDHNQSQ